MGLFGGLTRAIGGLLGGGGGSASASQSTTNKTNISTSVNVDLEPLGKILADSQNQTDRVFTNSQRQTAQVFANGLEQSAKTEKEAQQISFINEERNRALEIQKQNKLDTYLEHAKNGLLLSSVVVALLYVSKKGKKNAK